MKELVLLTILGLTIQVNAGFFSNNDKAYYLKNIDEAKEKVKDCELDLKAAIIARDGDKFKELEKDEECQNAKEAIKEHRKIERAKQEVKDKAAYEENYKEAISEFKKMPYDEFVKLQNKLPLSLSFGRKYNPENARFDAYKEVKKEKDKIEYEKRFKTALEKYKEMPYEKYIKDEKYRFRTYVSDKKDPKEAEGDAYATVSKEKKQIEISRIKNSYKNEKLLTYKKEVCKKSSFDPICKMVEKIYNDHKKEVLKYYKDNKSQLKKDFIDCERRSKKYKSISYNKYIQITKSYICETAEYAAKELGLSHGYGYGWKN